MEASAEGMAERVVVPAQFFLSRSSGLRGSGYGTRYAVDSESASAAAAAVVSGASVSGTSVPGSPSQREAAVKVEELVEDLDLALQAEERRVDLLLLLAKCSVPALFVAIGGAVAIPADKFLTDGMRTATEEMAGGALLVTYAFELTKGYTLHAPSGDVSIPLVIWSFLGTFLSGQLQAAAQGMWPYSGGGGMGEALPFFIAFFVDGVVLAYDTPAPPSEAQLDEAERAEEAEAEEQRRQAAEDEGEARPRGYRRTTVSNLDDDDELASRTRAHWAGGARVNDDARPSSAGMEPASEGADVSSSSSSSSSNMANDTSAASSSAQEDALGTTDAPGHTTSAVVPPAAPRRRSCCCLRGRRSRRCWRRVSPALSVLTFVVSIDNFVTGVGVYAALDTTSMPALGYYALFVCAIYLGGLVTALVRQIPSEGVQAGWFALGAFSLLDGGLELANSGLTEFVLVGFMIVWAILLAG